MHVHAKSLVEPDVAFTGKFHDPAGHWLLMHDPEDNEFCMV